MVEQSRRACSAVASGEADCAIIGGDVPDELAHVLKVGIPPCPAAAGHTWPRTLQPLQGSHITYGPSCGIVPSSHSMTRILQHLNLSRWILPLLTPCGRPSAPRQEEVTSPEWIGAFMVCLFAWREGRGVVYWQRSLELSPVHLGWNALEPGSAAVSQRDM